MKVRQGWGIWCAIIAAAFSVSIVHSSQLPASSPAGAATEAMTHRATLDMYCVTCHNDRLKTGGMSLSGVDLGNVDTNAELLERVVRKLRTRQMPPAGARRPDEATYDALAGWLEGRLDAAGAAHPNSGRSTLQRLNRTEYTNAIRDLFGLEFDGAALLPADNSGYGFDNIADVLSVSPALMERYLSAAAKISALVLGKISGSPSPEVYTVSSELDQQVRTDERLPFGARGGVAAEHYFPVDGEYQFKLRLKRTYDGILGLDQPQQIVVRLEGVEIRTFSVGGPTQAGGVEKPSSANASGDKPQSSDADGAERKPSADASGGKKRPPSDADAGMEFRLPVKAGTRLVTAYFVQVTSALVEDLVSPDLRSREPGGVDLGGAGISTLTITGPFLDGVHEPAGSNLRARILTCNPTRASDERPCASKILAALARRAYRRPVSETELQDVLGLYDVGSKSGGFSMGIVMALRGILMSPQFLFRFESAPTSPQGASYRLNDLDLASRLSFFIWSSIPDDELIRVAERGELRDEVLLERQVRRMLADPRSAALARNFVSQWLGVRTVPNLRPSPQVFLDFDGNLRDAFQRETEMFAETILREDRSIADFLDADYTFLNERLARHYGIQDVFGERFRRVSLPNDSVRRGLLGQGSILLATSYANRTSPVRRGKWILDNIFGTPPPPPPPDVPALPEQPTNGQKLSIREQMAQHRKNPVCASCHTRMDPLGFALENFDATGRWRTVDESGKPIDASGTLPDGATFQGVVSLRREIKRRSDAFAYAFTEKFLTYALGRGLEYYDAPSIRRIVRDAKASDYRFSSLVLETVRSSPFRMRSAPEPKREALNP